MKECHTCPFHAEIMTGKHKDTPWEKTPCSTCPAMDLDKKGRLTQPRALRGRVGQTRLSLDYETQELIDREHQMHEDPAEGLESHWDQVLRFIQCMMDLDMETREIILHRISGRGDMRSRARELGLSGAAAHARLKSAMRKHPWIARAVEIRRYSSEGRKVKKDELQLELF